MEDHGCGKCGSMNVSYQVVQTGATTKTKKKGILYKLGRWTLIICTLGLWLVFGKKASKSKTTFQTETVAVCQGCGNRWTVEK